MLKVRTLNAEGLGAFLAWLDDRTSNTPPPSLLDGNDFSVIFANVEIDPERTFKSRLEFGQYLNDRLAGEDFNRLMGPECDGLWAWIAVAYFGQLTEKGIRRAEHYMVTRKGSTGSLAYRHSVRTPYELVHVHGFYAEICLNTPMHTFGDMTEQLASRQSVAHNRGFFKTAYELYVADGKLKRGASSKPKKLNERKPGDRTGLGSVRRLAVALQRLDLTHDTEVMESSEMRQVLPREFKRYMIDSAQAGSTQSSP